MSSAYFKLRFLKKLSLKLAINNEGNTCQDCIICLKQGKVSISNMVNGIEISEVLFRLCDIDFLDYKLPIHLCSDCYSFLQQAVVFKNTAKLTENARKPNLHLMSAASNTNSEPDSSIQVQTLDKCKSKIKSDFNNHKCRNSKHVRVQCSICLRLVTSSLYNRHLLRHKNTTHLVCDICGKLYRKDNLDRHLKSHNYELPFHCHVCPYRGRFAESLAIHMRTHSGDKPFSCNKCNLRFLTRSNLNRHFLTHRKERPYKCIECGRGFITKMDLDLHYRCDHAGIKDFECRLCGTKYGTKRSLMRHELRFHKREKMAKGRMPLYLQAEYRK